MRPLEVIKKAEGLKFTSEDGDVDKLKLLPPLTSDEIDHLQAQLPCRIPEEIRELLCYCRGFDGVLESIDFSGLAGGFGMEEIFPCALPIAHDGFGNYWIVDLTKESTTWGPIYFACHDSPVIVFQTDSLSHFIEEVLRLGNSPWKGEIDDVHEKYHHRIWKENPDVLTYEQCVGSGDTDLANFAEPLGQKYLYIDMRKPKVGDGFSWGRYGAKTVNKRYGEKRIFAYEVRTSFLQRLFGKK
jgi:cell wall assembly regulator SMI1